MRKIKIAFLGSDAAGKTTLINYTKNRLEKEGKTVRTLVMGWKDFQNPILRTFSKIYLKNKAKSKIKEERLDRFRPRGWFFYFIYYLELWPRYLEALLSKKEFILMDRYFYDELVFAQGLKFKFFKLITPKPNLCFVLRAPIKILSKRNYNPSPEKLENFYNHLYKIANFTTMVKIDSSKPLEKIYHQIREHTDL